VGLVLGGALLVVFVAGVRWMLQTRNRKDDGDSFGSV